MTNIRKIDLNLFVAFDALYDLRNVTRAAERLSLTQPTVSGMLGRLRDLLGDPLFIRTQHGITPTPRADDLSEPVKALLADAAALIAPAEFDPETAEMTVGISANDYLQDALVVPFIARLRCLAPGLQVAIHPAHDAELFDLLARGALDLAITIPEFADKRLPRSLLYTERYLCVARAEHPLKSGKISLEQFCKFDHLLVSPTGGRFLGPTDDVLNEYGFTRRVAASLPSFHILMQTLLQGDFFAMVPSRILVHGADGYKRFEPPVTPPDFDVIACWHPRLSSDPAHRWIRELLGDVASTVG